MKIRIYPDEILLQPCEEIDDITADIKKFIDKMITFANKLDNCIGLAANQVGRSLRVFIVRSPRAVDFKVFINPEIISRKDIGRSIEGCLSEPGDVYSIRRSKTIKVRYCDIDGNEHVESFFKLASYIFQHELDHINGVLMRTKKKAKKLDQKTLTWR